jgi:hypothetical protein
VYFGLIWTAIVAGILVLAYYASRHYLNKRPQTDVSARELGSHAARPLDANIQGEGRAVVDVRSLGGDAIIHPLIG